MCFLFLEHVATAKRFFWFVYSVSKKIASFHCYYFSQKQAFVINSPQVYLGIPSANISLSAWEDQRRRCATAGSAIWHILAHRRL